MEGVEAPSLPALADPLPLLPPPTPCAAGPFPLLVWMLPAPLHPLHQHPRWEFRRRRSQHFLPCGLLSNPAPYVPCLCCETAGCSSGMNGSLHHSREGCKMCLCSRGAAKPASASCWAVRSDLVQAAQCPLSRWPRYLDCLLFGKFVQGLLDLHSIPSFTPQLF